MSQRSRGLTAAYVCRRGTRSWLQRYILSFLLGGVVFWATDPQGQAAFAKVVMAEVAVNPRQASLWVPQEQGFFNKYGLDVEVVFIRTTPLQVAAVTSGDVNVAYGAAGPVIGAVAGGADLKIFAGFMNYSTYNLVSRPEIKNPRDLHGKRFGIQSFGGAVWMGAMLGLEHLGLDPRRDNIRVLVIGDQTILAQALEANVIDATVLDSVFSQRLRGRGFNVLADLSEAKIPQASSVLFATQSYLLKHADVAENILKGMIEGLAFIFSPANKSAVLKTIMRRLKITDLSDAEEGYRGLLRAVDKKPYPSMEGLRNIQRLMQPYNPLVGNVRMENLVDNRFLKRVDESGFIDRVYSAYGVK